MENYQTPRGTQDILPADSSKWHHIEEIIRSVCYYYGYQEIRTPVFEDTKVFKRENDSSDMVNKEMYTFSVNGEDSLTLRPEGTAGVIRSFVQHKMYGNMEMPAKLYYMGEMFRHERPQKGRYRQFVQFGVENVGIKSALVDAEVIALGYSIIKALGLSDVKVLINTLGDDESRNNYRQKLSEHFKGCISELCEDCQRRYKQNPLRILDCKIDHDHISMKNVPNMADSLTQESKDYFNQVLSALDSLDIPYEIDNKLVRGLDYYTHTVFEVVSTNANSGTQSAVFAGGRYDGLVKYFGGPELSGVGFAMGLERLLLLAQGENVELGTQESTDIYVMNIGDVQALTLKVAMMCRASGYRTEFNENASRSLKAQFKSVDRKNAKLAIIIGETEAQNNEVNIKNTATQEQITVKIDDLISTIDEMLGE